MNVDIDIPRSRGSEMHKVQIRKRKKMTIFAEIFTILSLASIAMVLLGNTHLSPIVNNLYFLKLDTSTQYPPEDTRLAESMMKYITDLSGAKLAHFYQVGMWNYCEGYENKGITYCSSPSLTHYFNPVEMMISRALPEEYEPPGMANALHNSQYAHKAMFASYFLGGFFTLLSLLTDWISIISSRNYILTSVFAFVSGLFTLAGATVSTFLFVRFWSWLDETPGITVQSQLGGKIYACVWFAVAFTWAAVALHVKIALMPASGKPGWKMATSADTSEEEMWRNSRPKW